MDWMAVPPRCVAVEKRATAVSGFWAMGSRVLGVVRAQARTKPPSAVPATLATYRLYESRSCTGNAAVNGLHGDRTGGPNTTQGSGFLR